MATKYFNLVIGLFVFAVIVGFGSYTMPKYDPTKDMLDNRRDSIELCKANAALASEKATNTSKSNVESTSDRLRNKINEKISNKYFVSDENGLYTVIHFEPVNESAPVGAMILSQNHCDYSYSYTINGGSISIEFVKSSCGTSSSNTTIQYDETGDNLYMVIGGGKFIFKDLVQ